MYPRRNPNPNQWTEFGEIITESHDMTRWTILSYTQMALFAVCFYMMWHVILASSGVVRFHWKTVLIAWSVTLGVLLLVLWWAHMHFLEMGRIRSSSTHVLQPEYVYGPAVVHSLYSSVFFTSLMFFFLWTFISQFSISAGGLAALEKSDWIAQVLMFIVIFIILFNTLRFLAVGIVAQYWALQSRQRTKITLSHKP